MSSNNPTLPLSHPLLRTQMGMCILFGFVAIFLVAVLARRARNEREERREAERRERLVEEGRGLQDGVGVGEKGRDRERVRVVRDFRSEREAEERAREKERGVAVED
jgi:hypothetical protein